MRKSAAGCRGLRLFGFVVSQRGTPDQAAAPRATMRPTSHRRARSPRRAADSTGRGRLRPPSSSSLHRLPQRSRQGRRPVARRFDAAQAVEHAAVAEKIIRKLRAGMMPPPGAQAPGRADARARSPTALESRMDAAARCNPNPGWRPFQRLNRAEYARAVKDLLGLDVDVTAFLPPDTISDGFDNVADVADVLADADGGLPARRQPRSAALAVGDRDAEPTRGHLQAAEDRVADGRVDGAPFGTRGGISVDAHVPGRRRVRLQHGSARTPLGLLFGGRPSGRADRGLDRRRARRRSSTSTRA